MCIRDRKQAVLTDFKDAPSKETTDGPFQPLIVVATSAFGLGVNRNDIRNVICLTPPTDLAALYLQALARLDAAAAAAVLRRLNDAHHKE